MLIVDAQIHLWEKGTPSPQHRQEPYSAAEAIAAIDQAGVEPGADPPGAVGPGFEQAGDGSGADIPIASASSAGFIDDPNGSGLVAHWKERPGMVGLRFY